MVLGSMLLTTDLQEAVSNGQYFLRMASGETINVVPKTVVGRVAVFGLGEDGEISFVKSNIRAGQGVVHITNGLFRPKFMSMTVMDVLAAQSRLSTFTSLIVTAGLESVLRDVDAGITVSRAT